MTPTNPGVAEPTVPHSRRVHLIAAHSREARRTTRGVLDVLVVNTLQNKPNSGPLRASAECSWRTRGLALRWQGGHRDRRAIALAPDGRLAGSRISLREASCLAGPALTGP